jgi:hypothetical protein
MRERVRSLAATIIRSKLTVPILLLANFMIRILIFYSTKHFHILDYKLGLHVIDVIKETGGYPLRVGNYMFLNSYVGYFFKYILGNISYWFVFNCLIGTLAGYFLYLFVLELWGEKSIAVATLLLLSIYSEFLGLSSVFYTQVIEIFVFSLILYLLIKFDKEPGLKKTIIYALSLAVLVNLSLFFKQSLRFVWILLLIYSFSALVIFKSKRQALKFFFLSATIIVLTWGLLRTHPNIRCALSIQDVGQEFIFFGHTEYGGDGGECGFVYPEKKALYTRNYEVYLKEKNIQEPNLKTENAFQMQEVKKFLFKSPLKWMWLQARKLARTYGIIPEGTNFRVLGSGLFKGNWIWTSLFLQIPFVFLIMSSIVFFNAKLIRFAHGHSFFLLYILLFLYWIAATVLFGCTSERYRIPVVASFIIPCLAFFLLRIKNDFKMSLRFILPRLLIVVLVLGIWISQAYSVFAINKGRFNSAVQQIKSGELQ